MAYNYKIQMAYPTQKRYYDMDLKNTKAKAEATIKQMKKEGYGGMKFRIKKVHVSDKLRKLSKFIK